MTSCVRFLNVKKLSIVFIIKLLSNKKVWPKTFLISVFESSKRVSLSSLQLPSRSLLWQTLTTTSFNHNSFNSNKLCNVEVEPSLTAVVSKVTTQQLIKKILSKFSSLSGHLKKIVHKVMKSNKSDRKTSITSRVI